MNRSDRRQREIAARWILLDLNRWRAIYDASCVAADIETCEALWNLPARQPRKETGQ